MSWLNLSNDLTKKAIRDLELGQVLMFDFEGSPTYIKIMKKENGKIWGKRLKPELFLTPQEADDTVTVVPKT